MHKLTRQGFMTKAKHCLQQLATEVEKLLRSIACKILMCSPSLRIGQNTHDLINSNARSFRSHLFYSSSFPLYPSFPFCPWLNVSLLFFYVIFSLLFFLHVVPKSNSILVTLTVTNKGCDDNPSEICEQIRKKVS